MVAARKEPEGGGGRGRRRLPKREVKTFYGGAVDEAERLLLEEAGRMEGLDEEIALLRMKLAQALQDRPEDHALLLKGIELLVKAVSARYRLSPASKKDLAHSIEEVLRQVGGALYPEAFRDS